MLWQGPPEFHNEGGAERYLITYADMITLLLVLFIILYATANQDLEKFKALSKSLSEGFGATVPTEEESPVADETASGGESVVADTSGGGDKPVQMYPDKQAPIKVFDFARQLSSEGELRQRLEDIVKQANAEAAAELGQLKGGIQVSYNERGIVITIHPDQILFASGTATLKPGFKRVLDTLAPELLSLPNGIEVDGHTDSAPIRTAIFPSNWELSAARAGAVIRYFEGRGIPRERLSAAGYADTRPVGDNLTPEGRAANRRVEIVILRHAAESAAPLPAARTAPEAAEPESSAVGPAVSEGQSSAGGH